MSRTALTLAASVAAGLAVALLTGLVDVTPGGLVGATWYGYPEVWLRRLVIAPQYNPWRVDGLGLAADVVFWCVVAVVVSFLAARLLRRSHP
jgi:hypothetical protein